MCKHSGVDLQLSTYNSLLSAYMPTMSETPGNTQSTMDDTQASFPNWFTLEKVAAVYSTFKVSFSNNKRQVAARALLQHNVHVDGTHYQAKSPGGLHPCYVGLPLSSLDDKEHALFRAEIVQASLHQQINKNVPEYDRFPQSL